MNIKDDNKLKILFLCTGNSCRSQMAEGFAHHLRGDEIEPFSAGVAPKGIDPRATRAMAEAGVDISNQNSTSLEEVKHIEFDHVVTLCDSAQKSCPSFPGKTKVTHVGFEDPPKLAESAKDEEEAMVHYQRVRDEIRAFVESLPELLLKEGTSPQRRFQAGIEAALGQLPKELRRKKGV
jgi:arsenate reductase